MRVYEYAKEQDVSSKEVLTLLSERGIVLSSHMAQLPDEALSILNAAYKKKSTPKAALASSTPKKDIIAESVVAKEKKESKSPVSPSKKGDSGRNSSSEKRPSQKRNYKKARGNRVVAEVENEVVDIITISSDMTVGEVAQVMKKKPNEIIFELLKAGLMKNINNVLTTDEIVLLGEKVDIEVLVDAPDLGVKDASIVVKDNANTKPRLPIVVVMGHVDHGKTTLLDYLRKSNVASREEGGITQHLGAYEVSNGSSKLVFLDTPGHEAFTYMRSRGASVTDLVVLIVAVNDGVKPQTLEAIKIAKESGVPIVVAVNKIDKMSSPDQLDQVKTQLSQHDLVPEDWGGETVCVGISAKTGENVDELIDMLQLHADMLDLEADYEAPAKAFVLETKVVKGHGTVVTVICKQGTLKRGDYFICGDTTGKVRLLIDSNKKQVKSVGPSVPVQVVGFDSSIGIGDWLEVVPQSVYASSKGQKSQQKQRLTSLLSSSDEVEEEHSVNLILKADTQGSCKALSDMIEKIIKNPKYSTVDVTVIHNEVGDITEGDVIKADNTNSYVYGLHVKTERNATALAKQKEVDVKNFGVIYHLLEDIEALIAKHRKVEYDYIEMGNAKVLKVFDIKGLGIVAGCSISTGVIRPGYVVACLRNKKEIGRATVKTLQRERSVVKEVRAGHECGFTSNGFQDWQPNDSVIIYEKVVKED